MSLYIAFIDLTKAFDLVSRDGLFKTLERIGCLARLLSIIRPFTKDPKNAIPYDDLTSGLSKSTEESSRVGVLAPTLFEILFAFLLKRAFGDKTKVNTCIQGYMERFSIHCNS